MNTLGNRLRELRESRKMTQTDLSKIFGMKTYTTVSKWESGDNLPRGKDLKMLAEYFGVSSDYLLGLKDYTENDIAEIYNQLDQMRKVKVYNFAEAKLKEQNTVRVYGQVAANPTAIEYTEEVYDDYIVDNVPNAASGALVINGDSMEPNYPNGSIVFFKNQESIENGEIAIVDIDGDGATCKKVIFDYENEKVILRSLNADYPDRELDGSRVKFVGKVINWSMQNTLNITFRVILVT